MYDGLLEGVHLRDALQDLSVDFLKHTRNGQEHRRPYALQIPGEVVRPRKVDGRSVVHESVLERTRKDVRERQEGDGDLAVRTGTVVGDAAKGGQRVVADVLMGEHYALGPAGRSTRVNDRREVVRSDLIPELVDGPVVVVEPASSVIPYLGDGAYPNSVRHLGEIFLLDAFGHNDGSHARTRRQHVCDGIEMVEVGDGNDGRLRMVDDVLDLLLLMGKVNGHVDHAGHQASHVDDAVVHVAFHVEGNAVSSIQPEVHQADGELFGVTTKIVQGKRLPPVILRLVEGFEVLVALRSFVEKLRERHSENRRARTWRRGINFPCHGRVVGWKYGGIGSCRKRFQP